MKKILFSITLLLASLLFSQSVNASSFNVNIVGNDTFENEITLYIQVNNLVDFNGVCNGLCGLVGNLNYDINKIELISISTLEDFELTKGNTIVLYKTTGVSSGTKILSMKFRNKSLTKNETTTITFSNVVASDGDKDINAKDTSKMIKFIVKETENNNQINNKPDTSKKEEIKKSSNNYLSAITLSNGTIDFDKDTLTYDVLVGYEITNIEIEAKQEDNKAIIIGNGIHNLNVGINTIKLIIKAEDESERIYTLNIRREEEKIVVEEEKDIVENELIEKENGYVIPIIIISLIIIVGIIGFVAWKKKNNK